MDICSSPLDDVLIVNSGKDGAENLDEDEDTTKNKLDKVVGDVAHVGDIHHTLAGAGACCMNHASNCQNQQGDPLFTTQRFPEQDL